MKSILIVLLSLITTFGCDMTAVADKDCLEAESSITKTYRDRGNDVIGARFVKMPNRELVGIVKMVWKGQIATVACKATRDVPNHYYPDGQYIVSCHTVAPETILSSKGEFGIEGGKWVSVADLTIVIGHLPYQLKNALRWTQSSPLVILALGCCGAADVPLGRMIDIIHIGKVGSSDGKGSSAMGQGSRNLHAYGRRMEALPAMGSLHLL
jgi:hypothetical protein